MATIEMTCGNCVYFSETPIHIHNKASNYHLCVRNYINENEFMRVLSDAEICEHYKASKEKKIEGER